MGSRTTRWGRERGVLRFSRIISGSLRSITLWTGLTRLGWIGSPIWPTRSTGRGIWAGAMRPGGVWERAGLAIGIPFGPAKTCRSRWTGGRKAPLFLWRIKATAVSNFPFLLFSFLFVAFCFMLFAYIFFNRSRRWGWLVCERPVRTNGLLKVVLDVDDSVCFVRKLFLLNWTPLFSCGFWNFFTIH